MTTVAANTLSLAALVALYNTAADKPVKAFKDKPTAIARVEKLAAEKDLDIQVIDEVATFVENVDPTEDNAPVEQVVEKPAKAPKAKKAPKVKKETSGVRGPAPDYADDAVISTLVVNPKRPSGRSYDRFALYTDGMTVGTYLTAAAALQGGKPGKYRADLAWDVAHGFIRID